MPTIQIPQINPKRGGGSKAGKIGGVSSVKASEPITPKVTPSTKQTELSPVKSDLKTPRYFTSPENDEMDFRRRTRRYEKRVIRFNRNSIL